ncbi:hypothetical protein GCM10027167_36100 [Nocardia heshunensis]
MSETPQRADNGLSLGVQDLGLRHHLDHDTCHALLLSWWGGPGGKRPGWFAAQSSCYGYAPNLRGKPVVAPDTAEPPSSAGLEPLRLGRSYGYVCA